MSKINKPLNLFLIPEEQKMLELYGDRNKHATSVHEAVAQLRTALNLPVTLAAAGMPDLHKGYSLPIGGVAVLDNAVSPAFIGFDISCMMKLSVLDYGDDDLIEHEERERFLKWVLAATSFGIGSELADTQDHPVMYDPLWSEIPFLRQHKDLAWRQLGSSGSGNHFCDVVYARNVDFNTRWIGLMTHSGSRGVGNKAGQYYSKLADERTLEVYPETPKGYGWLELGTDLGEEYWQVMELMGRYAKANHDIVHRRFSQISGIATRESWYNQHNFAEEVIPKAVIHRKGATPANRGQVGIIPGSSGSTSYLVIGQGNNKSLVSASHGAGRPFSRTEAKRRHDQEVFDWTMDNLGITYAGVNADETVYAYKSIDKVIQTQVENDIIRVVAKLYPRVVVMGGRNNYGDGD